MSNGTEGLAYLLLYVIGLLVVAALVGFLLIQAVVCWVISGCFKRVPERHRNLKPGLVWLLMIPGFNMVWNFMVFPRLSECYKACFDAVNDASVGDCGKQLSAIYCVSCWACPLVALMISLVPFGEMVAVAFTGGPLVLLIVCVLNAVTLKNRIPL